MERTFIDDGLYDIFKLHAVMLALFPRVHNPFDELREVRLRQLRQEQEELIRLVLQDEVALAERFLQNLAKPLRLLDQKPRVPGTVLRQNEQHLCGFSAVPRIKPFGKTINKGKKETARGSKVDS